MRSLLCGLIVLAVFLPSCLFVKAPEDKVEVQNVALSPRPEIEMSDNLVRTRAGDLIALLPKNWVFLDTRNEASADIITVAVNPDYTLSMVVSSIPAAESSRERMANEGLLGLARSAYQKHVRKTGGMAKLVGGYRIAEYPITFVDRVEGVSKMSGRIVAESMVRVTLWGLRDRVNGLRSALGRRRP